MRVGSLLKKEKQWIISEYDFGDGWEHKIILEKIFPYKPGEKGPKCIVVVAGDAHLKMSADPGDTWIFWKFMRTKPTQNTKRWWNGQVNILILNGLTKLKSEELKCRSKRTVYFGIKINGKPPWKIKLKRFY